MIIIIHKLPSCHPFNPTGFFPVAMLRKQVFKHEDDLYKVIIQGDCIELDSALTLKVSSKSFGISVVAIQLMSSVSRDFMLSSYTYS